MATHHRDLARQALEICLQNWHWEEHGAEFCDDPDCLADAYHDPLLKWLRSIARGEFIIGDNGTLQWLADPAIINGFKEGDRVRMRSGEWKGMVGIVDPTIPRAGSLTGMGAAVDWMNSPYIPIRPTTPPTSGRNYGAGGFLASEAERFE